jgi:hypothetical protein
MQFWNLEFNLHLNRELIAFLSEPGVWVFRIKNQRAMDVLRRINKEG